MRILFVSGSFNQGGAEFQILSLANLMKLNGHYVHVIALTDYEFYKGYLKENDIQFNCLSNFDNKINRIWKLSRFIIDFKPDTIIAFLKSTSLATIFARTLSNHRCRLLLGERTALVKPVRDYFHFIFWHKADIITTNSVSKINYFHRNFPRLRSKLYLVKNVYDSNVFELAQNNELLYQADKAHLVFVGRVSPEKNVHKLIEVFSRLIKSGYNALLHIYGDSRNVSYRATLNELINKLGISDLVQFEGVVKGDKLKHIYSQADLICLLSEYEGFSNVLAESLMQGCIPIVSNIPENIQVVKEGITGFTVDINSIDSIENGFIRFFNLTVEDKVSMRNRNMEFIREFLDRDSIYLDYLKLIQ